jgi:hypothetical protein
VAACCGSCFCTAVAPVGSSHAILFGPRLSLQGTLPHSDSDRKAIELGHKAASGSPAKASPSSAWLGRCRGTFLKRIAWTATSSRDNAALSCGHSATPCPQGQSRSHFVSRLQLSRACGQTRAVSISCGSGVSGVRGTIQAGGTSCWAGPPAEVKDRDSASPLVTIRHCGEDSSGGGHDRRYSTDGWAGGGPVSTPGH